MSNNNSKKVFTGVELGVNYVTHLYTLAEAGFEDENYKKEYGNSILLKDIEYLKSHSEYMSFLKKDHGYFTRQLYFVPSYFNMKTKKDYEDYFRAWIEAIKQKSYTPIEKYSYFFNDYREMFKVAEESWEKILSIEPIFNKIGEIYINNIEYYCTNIWPEIKPILLKKSQRLNKRIENDLIKKWEQVTEYRFNKNMYYVVLFFAGENGPSFNNLSFDKNTAFYNLEEKCMLDMISHELGIHILLPKLIDLIKQFDKELPQINKPDIYGNVSYMAFESLASFYNMRVLNRKTKDIDLSNDFYTFIDIYNKLYSSGLRPLKIFNEGVKEYMKLNKGYY